MFLFIFPFYFPGPFTICRDNDHHAFSRQKAGDRCTCTTVPGLSIFLHFRPPRAAFFRRTPLCPSRPTASKVRLATSKRMIRTSPGVPFFKERRLELPVSQAPLFSITPGCVEGNGEHLLVPLHTVNGQFPLRRRYSHDGRMVDGYNTWPPPPPNSPLPPKSFVLK